MRGGGEILGVLLPGMCLRIGILSPLSTHNGHHTLLHKYIADEVEKSRIYARSTGKGMVVAHLGR